MRPKFALPAFLAADQIDDRGATSLPPAHTLSLIHIYVGMLMFSTAGTLLSQ